MRRFMQASALGALAAWLLLAGSASAATTTVSGDTSAGENQPGWLFARDPANAVPYEFTLHESSIGFGSLFVPPLPADPPRKFIAEDVVFAPVADIQSIAYDFLIAGTGTTSPDNFYVNVYANIDDSTNFYDCRFDYVATTGSTSDFTTHTVDATDTPTNVAKRGSRLMACPPTLAGMPAGSHVRAFTLNVGDTGASDANLAGYLDNVVLTTSAVTTVYDFEPTKDACKSGGSDFAGSSFDSQGDCVSSLQANPKAGK